MILVCVWTKCECSASSWWTCSILLWTRWGGCWEKRSSSLEAAIDFQHLLINRCFFVLKRPSLSSQSETMFSPYSFAAQMYTQRQRNNLKNQQQRGNFDFLYRSNDEWENFDKGSDWRTPSRNSTALIKNADNFLDGYVKHTVRNADVINHSSTKGTCSAIRKDVPMLDLLENFGEW